MRNVKVVYKNFVMRKKRIFFFLCHVKMNFFLPRGYIFDVRDNKNTSLWHKILNAQNKNLDLHEKQCSTKKGISCRQKQDDDPQKNILCSKKLIFFGIARHSFIVKKVVCSKFYVTFYQGIG